MSTGIEDVAGSAARAAVGNKGPGRRIPASSLAGASPAVPRDPRLLQAEQADYDAKLCEAEAKAAKAAAEQASARAAAALSAAEKAKADLATAREEAKAKAEAAALAVRLEREELDQAAASARVARRATRDEQLGTVHTAEIPEPKVITVVERRGEGFSASLMLFLVRLVLAVFAVLFGWQTLIDRQSFAGALSYIGASDQIADLGARIISIGLLVVAVFLLLGLGTRLFGIVLFIATVVFLVFYRFGPFSPFIEGRSGFYGDRELLFAVLTLVPVLMGAGKLSIDAHLRRRRQKAKQKD